MIEIVIFVFLSFVCFLITRILFLILKIKGNNHRTIKRSKPAKTIICIGSGGHTTEMIKLIEKVNPKNYTPRYYIMASNDFVSEEKILKLEKLIYKSNSAYNILKIPRSRVVNQSYFTSVFTTIKSSVSCIPIVFKIKPDLILCNGPGTCIPVCLIAFLMKVLYLCDTKIIFVESVCRVESLSLTGLILSYFADYIVVQWKELTRICKRADYLGQLF